MRFAHGNYIEIADLDIIPKITPEEAKNIFAKHLKIDLQLVKDFKSELLIKCMNNKITGGNSNPLLVYCISLEANSINNTAIGYVNAHDGKIEDIEKTTCDINALALFDTRYYGTQYSITDNVNNEYRLYDESRGAVIHTRKLNGMPYNTGVITEITDDDNYWHYTDFTNRGDMGLDVHWSLQKIYDRLYNVHGINSFNNNGVPIYAFPNHRDRFLILSAINEYIYSLII